MLLLICCWLFRYFIMHTRAVCHITLGGIASFVQLKGKNHGDKQTSSCSLGIIFLPSILAVAVWQGEARSPFWGHARSIVDLYTMMDLSHVQLLIARWMQITCCWWGYRQRISSIFRFVGHWNLTPYVETYIVASIFFESNCALHFDDAHALWFTKCVIIWI